VEGRYSKRVGKFSVLYVSNLLENTCMMLPSNLRSIFLQHPSKLDLNFYQYFTGNLSNCKWIRDLSSHLPIVLYWTRKI